MTAYHRVFSRLWVNPAFRSCSEDGRHALVYLLTCPHRNTEGLFRLPIPLAAYDLGWQADRTGQALAELETAGFIAIDRDVDLVWLVNAVKWNAPRGPKQIKGAVNVLAEVPSSPLRAWYLIRCRSVCPDLADAIAEHLGWSETVSEGFPYPFDSSISFSSSSSTPPTPPSPDTQADPDSAGLVVVGLADRLVQTAMVDPTVLADDSERSYVAEALAAGVTESAMLGIAVDATTKARRPRGYLRGGIERLTAEASTKPAPVGPNPLANIADDVPVPPMPAPETTKAGLAAARAAMKRATA